MLILHLRKILITPHRPQSSKPSRLLPIRKQAVRDEFIRLALAKGIIITINDVDCMKAILETDIPRAVQYRILLVLPLLMSWLRRGSNLRITTADTTQRDFYKVLLAKNQVLSLSLSPSSPTFTVIESLFRFSLPRFSIILSLPPSAPFFLHNSKPAHLSCSTRIEIIFRSRDTESTSASEERL